MSYVYKRELGIWIVGHFDDNVRWVSESDHDSAEKAAERVHWLNGGMSRQEIQDFAEILCRNLAERAVCNK